MNNMVYGIYGFETDNQKENTIALNNWNDNVRFNINVFTNNLYHRHGLKNIDIIC